MPHSAHVAATCLALLAILVIHAPASAQRPQPGAAPPRARAANPHDERLRASWGYGFESTFRAVRVALAANVPDGAPGLAARASLRQETSDTAGAVALYDECVRRFPAYEPCVSGRLGVVQAPDDATLMSWVEPVLRRAPSFPGLLVVRAARRLRDRALAQRWLAELEAQHPNSWAFEYLRALDAEDRGAHREAVERYQRALLDREAATRDAFERAAALIVRGIDGESRPARMARLRTLLERVERAKTPVEAARAYYVAGRMARYDIEDRAASLELHTRSYRLSPSPEAAHEAFVLLQYMHRYDDARSLAEEAVRRFADDPTPHADLGLSAMLHQEDAAAAEALYRRAVALAREPVELREITMRVVWEFFERMGRFADARALMEALPPESVDNGTRAQSVVTRLRNGDLAGARALLAENRQMTPNASEVWFFSQRERLDGYGVAPALVTHSSQQDFAPTFVASSPDGRHFSAGSGPVAIYDGRTGRALHHLRRGQRRVFSPDGRYLAAVSREEQRAGRATHALLVYEVASGRLVRFLDRDEPVRSPAWHPDGTRVAVFDNDGVILELNVTTGEVRAVRGGTARIPGPLAYSRDGRYLFSSAAQGRTVRVWNAATLQRERELTGVDWAHAMTTTADGRWLVVADNRRVITAFEIGTWTIRTARLSAMADDLTPHPSAPVVLVHGDYRDQATVFDVSSMTVVRDLPMRYGGSATFAGPSRILVEESDGLRTYDYPSLRARGLRATTQRAEGALVPLEGDRALLSAERHVAILDHEGRQAQRWNLAGLARPRVGREEVVIVAGTTMHVVPIGRGRGRRMNLPLDFDVQSLAVGRRWLVVGGVRGADPEGRRETPREGALAVFDIDTGAPVFRQAVPIVTRPQQYQSLYRSTVIVGIDEERTLVAATTRWQDGFGHLPTYSRQAQVGRIGESAPLRSVSVGFDAVGVDFASAGVVRLRGRRSFETFSVETGQSVERGEEQMELGGGRRLLWDQHRVEVIDAEGRVLAEQEVFARVASVVRLSERAVAVLDTTGEVRTMTLPPLP